MNVKWPTVRLGEVLKQRKEFVSIQDLKSYKRLRVQLHAKGVVFRDEVDSALIKTKQQQTCRAGEFLVAEIDAKVGGFGIIPDALDGAIVSNHYFLFVVDKTKLDLGFLDYFIRTPAFYDQVVAQGSTNYAAIRPTDVLSYEIPLPPLAEQQRIVARIDELSTKVQEARVLRQQAVEETEAIVIAKLRDSIRECNGRVRYLPFTEISQLIRRPVKIKIDQYYKEIGVYSFGRGIFHKAPRTGAEVGDKKLYQICADDFILQVTFAWEGAVALAEQKDDGLYGSVRYLTFRVNEDICSPWYLLTYMKTPEAISQLGVISPGSAGRNRVLSVKRLREIVIPVIPAEQQEWMSGILRTELKELKRFQAETASELDAIMPSILDRTFKGDL